MSLTDIDLTGSGSAFDWNSAIETLTTGYVAIEQTRLTGAAPSSELTEGVPQAAGDPIAYGGGVGGIDQSTLMIIGGAAVLGLAIYLAVK